ncbi:MAG: hypothetical protein IK031_05765 [Bacteroidales bacterium]|nr:hypothetical protein [Bacteroidales bacterium]
MKIQMSAELWDLYCTGKSKQYKDVSRNPVLYSGFVRVVNVLALVDNTNELRNISALHYEQLKYQYYGYSSVRLSNSYVHRLLFTESDKGLKVELITIDDTHYGNKK